MTGQDQLNAQAGRRFRNKLIALGIIKVGAILLITLFIAYRYS
jgi:hypothetical protein